MNNKLIQLIENSNRENYSFKPVFFRLGRDEHEMAAFEEHLQDGVLVADRIREQLKDLIKCRHPQRPLKEEEYEQLIAQHLNGVLPEDYGVWVYYPWSRRFVHLLDEAEFVEVRTNRNKHKITDREEAVLAEKKVGIVGLSVGQSIALTMATERACGELRLADFDEIELSNLNRIRTGVHNLGVNKAVMTAREIAEIDPYLKVTVYDKGLQQDNMDAFFTDGGQLDLLIEECDSLDMKIICRARARDLQIPVIMDTSDRGMIDVERFDLEPERPLLHGLTGDLDVARLKDLSPEERILLVLQIAGTETVSARGKASLVEVGQSISTWPQLASSVILGGGATTDTARRVLLGQFNESGRYYVDPETIIRNSRPAEGPDYTNPYGPLTGEERAALIARALPESGTQERDRLDKELVHRIVTAAVAAPTTGNDQPWLWDYRDGLLFLFHDRIRSHSFGDYKYTASYLSFGAAIENIELAAGQEGLQTFTHIFSPEQSPLIAVLAFKAAENQLHPYPKLAKQVFTRHTNRTIAPRQEPDAAHLQQIREITESLPGAQLGWITDPEQIRQMGGIIGACDRIRILNPRGHADFVQREMRWTAGEAEQLRDGIDVRTLGLSKGQSTALSVVRSPEVIDVLRDVSGGMLFEMATRQSVAAASAIGLITMPGRSMEDFIQGGRAMERMWLAADFLDWAVHPVISPVYLFNRIILGNGEELSPEEIGKLQQLRRQFLELYPDNGRGEMFLFKLFKARKPEVLSMRRPTETVLTIH